MNKKKMVSNIFKAYEGDDMQITFYGLQTCDISTLGVVAVDGTSKLVIHQEGGKWNNGISSHYSPLESAREYLATDPRDRVVRLERAKVEVEEEFAYQRERLKEFPNDNGVKADFDDCASRLATIEEHIQASNAEHALLVEFNPEMKIEKQQKKTTSLINWIMLNSHSSAISLRESVCVQLEKETRRLYMQKSDQKKHEMETPTPEPKVVQTEPQIRLANALGIAFSPSDNLGDMISDEVRGFDALESVFDNLVSFTNATVQNRSSKIEMVPDKCPFCGITNAQYALFTFNNNGSYCFSCKESANIINTALAIRNHHYSSACHDDGTNSMTEEEAARAREEKAKQQEGARGKKSVWLGSYHKYNMRIYDVNHHDYRQVVNYFVNEKGLKESFVTVRLLPYLDKYDIRYNYCNYSYKTGERGIALNVPYVADRQRVRAIKRRLMDATLRQDAARWNFNIYPKANHESHLWTTHSQGSDVVVVVENQLDAAILNLISEMRGTINGLSFAAPLVPKNIDIALGASHLKDSSVIVLAYDLDDTGDHYVSRDFQRLKDCGFKAMTYVWEGMESESLLDTMTRTKFTLKELHKDILAHI